MADREAGIARKGGGNHKARGFYRALVPAGSSDGI